MEQVGYLVTNMLPVFVVSLLGQQCALLQLTVGR
jgi:hypothetical protein